LDTIAEQDRGPRLERPARRARPGKRLPGQLLHRAGILRGGGEREQESGARRQREERMADEMPEASSRAHGPVSSAIGASISERSGAEQRPSRFVLCCAGILWGRIDPMATRIRGLALAWWTAGAVAALASCAAAQPVPAPSKPDVTLGSRPETVIW